MTVATPKGRVQLNNVEELKAKRGVSVNFIYNIDNHKYIGPDGRVHYRPYTRGRKYYRNR